MRRELTPPAEMPALVAVMASQRLLIKTAQLLTRIARTQNNGSSIRRRRLVERLQKIPFARAPTESPDCAGSGPGVLFPEVRYEGRTLSPRHSFAEIKRMQGQ